MSTQAKAETGADSLIGRWIQRAGFGGERDFVLRVVPLAPIFAAAIASNSHTALIVGFSTALGAGVSMGWSEALSDTGELTGRGSAVVRGAITGGRTAPRGRPHP